MVVAQAESKLMTGEELLDMPLNEYDTVALWWDLPDDLPAELGRRSRYDIVSVATITRMITARVTAPRREPASRSSNSCP